MSNTAASLRTLAEQKTDGVAKSTVFTLNPALVTFEKGFNVREEGAEKTAHIEKIAAAMKAGAFVPPIDVRVEDGKIICIEGECRTRAALLVQKDIPDFTLTARQFTGNDQDRVLHMLGTGNGQKALNPLEQGIGFMRLEKFGMTRPQIAERLGISRMTVDNNIALAEAPQKVQDFIRSGDVSPTTARHVVKQGKAAIAALEKQVKENRAENAKLEKEFTEEALKADANGTGEEADATPKKKAAKGEKKGKEKKAPKKKAAPAKPKKKKVTQKKLKGTPAEKKKPKKVAEPVNEAAPVAPDHIRVDIRKEYVSALLAFKDIIGDEDAKAALAALENALLL